jgi:hypothetical protein
MTWITSAEFSRRMGCSRANVTQAIRSARLRPEHVRRDGTRVMVNTAAIPDWQATTSRRRGIAEPMPAAMPAGPIPAPRTTPMPAVECPGLPPPAWGAGGEEQSAIDASLSPEEVKQRLAQLPDGAVPDLLLSRMRREHALAQMAEIELAAMEEKLVSAAEMRRVHYDAGRLVRDAVLRVPTRIMPELAAAAGGLSPDQRQKVGLLLERHLVEALESLVQKQIESDGAEQG